jgi:hypothetical protein
VHPVQIRREIRGANSGLGGSLWGHLGPGLGRNQSGRYPLHQPRHLLCAEVAITGSLASMRTFLYRS